MKGVDEGKYAFENPYMNNSYSQNGYFIAEIRELDETKVEILKKYGSILIDKLKEKGKYSVEQTNYGFKLMRKVNQERDYTEDWDEWSAFSRLLYDELKGFFDNESYE